MSKNKLGFISFLQREFGVIDPELITRTKSFDSAEADYLIEAQPKIKKEVYKKTKLQKVLDAFIEDAKEGEGKYIDDELIKKWQQASREQKDEILKSFVNRHKNKKESLDLSSIAASEINGLKINYFQVILVSSVLFAFFLSSAIALSNPALINSISQKQKTFFSYIFGLEQVKKSNVVYVDEIEKQEMGNYIRQNQNALRTPIHRDRKTFSVPANEVAGRVAGVYEPNYELIATKEEKGDNILNRAGEFMYKLADKQIEISLKISEKIKSILK